jgi:hypothetical protein
MKPLILKLIIPLTILSFTTITKWWYVDIADAADDILIGFPLVYTCPCWHTSLCSQIFVMEFFIDILCYFLVWFAIVFCINRYLTKIKLFKSITITLYSLTLLITIASTLLVFNTDYVFQVKRDFNMKVLETGYQFTWQNTAQPDYPKYHLKKL